MSGGRQAWCPRCDEVRGARPGAPCPVCGRRLLALPPERPGQAQPGRADRLLGRLKALAPAAGAVGVALLVLAVVASAFAAGRLTRTTPSGPAAPTTTLAGFLDEGPETGRRDFNWEARSAGISVKLRSITVGARFTRLELHVDGVRRGREISALNRLRIRDGNGRDLLAGGVIDHIATATSHNAPDGGGLDTEVVLDRALDQGAVASVELGGLTVARAVSEELRASLLDPGLRGLLGSNVDVSDWLDRRGSCPGCRLRATCPDCRTIQVTGTAYHRGRLVIAVEAVGPAASSALSPNRRRVVVTGENGGSELPGWIDADGPSGVISFGADLLTAIGEPGPDDQPMALRVEVEALAEQAVPGTWTIREAGG